MSLRQLLFLVMAKMPIQSKDFFKQVVWERITIDVGRDGEGILLHILPKECAFERPSNGIEMLQVLKRVRSDV